MRINNYLKISFCKREENAYTAAAILIFFGVSDVTSCFLEETEQCCKNIFCCQVITYNYFQHMATIDI